MVIRLLVALLVLVGPLPSYICTCAHHAQPIGEPKPQSDGASAFSGEEACHCHHAQPEPFCPTCHAAKHTLDSLASGLPDGPGDFDAYSLPATDCPFPTLSPPLAYRVPSPPARSLPLYISLRSLRI